MIQPTRTMRAIALAMFTVVVISKPLLIADFASIAPRDFNMPAATDIVFVRGKAEHITAVHKRDQAAGVSLWPPFTFIIAKLRY